MIRRQFLSFLIFLVLVSAVSIAQHLPAQALKTELRSHQRGEGSAARRSTLIGIDAGHVLEISEDFNILPTPAPPISPHPPTTPHVRVLPSGSKAHRYAQGADGTIWVAGVAICGNPGSPTPQYYGTTCLGGTIPGYSLNVDVGSALCLYVQGVTCTGTTYYLKDATSTGNSIPSCQIFGTALGCRNFIEGKNATYVGHVEADICTDPGFTNCTTYDTSDFRATICEDDLRCIPTEAIGKMCLLPKNVGHGPCDISTGELWYQHSDFKLLGPFGLHFGRLYDSESSFNGDLGFGWRSEYDARLDLTHLPDLDVVDFEAADGGSEQFGTIFNGHPSYNDFTGDTLATDGSVYTLTTWHQQVYTFALSGRLIKITDRAGNTQTIFRNINDPNQITYVQDVFGRTLQFTYDSSDRIKTVTSSLPSGTTGTPSSVQVQFNYGPGTNCGSQDLCSVTEPDGGVWQYQYDSNSQSFPHNLTEVVDPNLNPEEVNVYCPVGGQAGYCTGRELQDQSWGSNQLAHFHIDYSHNGTQTDTNIVTDANGHQTIYTIDRPTKEILNTSGPMCRCGGDSNRALTYDRFARVTSVTNGDGATHTRVYSYTRDPVVQHTDGSGSTVIQALPGPTQITEPLNSNPTQNTRTTTFTYGTGAKLDLISKISYPSVESAGQKATISITYGPAGKPTIVTRKGKGSITSVATSETAAYNTFGQLTSWQGPASNVPGRLSRQVTIAYFPTSDGDALHRGQIQSVTQVVDSSHTLQWNLASAAAFASYDIFGQYLSLTDPNNQNTTFTFDALGRITKLTNPAGFKDTYTYDSLGNLVKQKRPANNSMRYIYDSAERLTNIIRDDASSLDREQVILGYDGASEVTSETLQACSTPANPCATWQSTRSESFLYDNFNRLQAVNHPISNGQQTSQSYIYDAAGNLQSVKDENHSSPNIFFSYDYANRLTIISQVHVIPSPAPSVTEIVTYDQLDDPVQLTDANGASTTNSYDDFKRLTAVVSPVSGQTSYGYDTDDTMTSIIDANQSAHGGSSVRAYDAIGRPTSDSTTVGASTEISTWIYDQGTGSNLAGRLASETDPSGTGDKITYSYNGRGLVTSMDQSISGHDFVNGFGYDTNGNQNQITYASNRVVNYTYDFADRQLTATLSPSTNLVTSTVYEPFGPIQELDFGNGMVQQMTYDARYNLNENLVKKGATIVADHTYAEDGIGHVTTISDSLDCGYSRALGYDDLGRLITANTGTVVNPSCNSGHSLWGSGSYAYDASGNTSSLMLGARTASFSYVSTSSRLQSVTSSNGPTGAVGYDGVGDETSIGSQNSYSYSPRELLASDILNGLTYKYDARRVRTKTTGAAGTRYSVYGPDLSMLSESSLTSATDAHDYVYVGDRPVAQLDSNGSHIDIGDHFGTPVIQTDISGSLPPQWQAEHEPFGSVYALRAGDVHQPLRLPGQIAQQMDAGANGVDDLVYNVSRWYRPLWGRYSQPDVVGLAGGHNLYSYAFNDPLGVNDPLGRGPFNWKPWKFPFPDICFTYWWMCSPDLWGDFLFNHLFGIQETTSWAVHVDVSAWNGDLGLDFITCHCLVSAGLGAGPEILPAKVVPVSASIALQQTITPDLNLNWPWVPVSVGVSEFMGPGAAFSLNLGQNVSFSQAYGIGTPQVGVGVSVPLYDINFCRW